MVSAPVATRWYGSASAVAGRKSTAAQAFISSRDVLWNVAPEKSTTVVLWLEFDVPPTPGAGWDASEEKPLAVALIVANGLDA